MPTIYFMSNIILFLCILITSVTQIHVPLLCSAPSPLFSLSPGLFPQYFFTILKVRTLATVLYFCTSFLLFQVNSLMITKSKDTF